MVIFKKNIYIQNGTFQKFLKSKFDPNILQKRTKLHHFKNIFGLACPRTPLAKRMALPCAACRSDMQISKSQNKFLPPSQI